MMKKGIEENVAACVGELTGAVVKDVVVDRTLGVVSAVLLPGGGEGGHIGLNPLPDVFRVSDVDTVAGTVSLVGGLQAVEDFVRTWNMDADDPRVRRFVNLLRRETRCTVSNVEFRSGELLYELTVPTMDFTAPEFVYVEGVDFRTRTLYCYTYMEDLNAALDAADSFYPVYDFVPEGKLKS